MSFLDDLRRRLRAVPGYAGGNLGEQLDAEQDPQVLTPTNQAAITRPRRVNPAPPLEPERNAMFDHLPRESDIRPRRYGPPEPLPDIVRQNLDRVPEEMNTAQRKRAVSFDPVTGRPNDDFYRSNPDQLAGKVGQYQAYQNWEPRGGKRGFKNSLKSGLMMAADAVRSNPNDPITAAIAGFGTGAIGGTAAPNFRNRLTRQWKLAQTGGELQNQLNIRKQQAQIDSMGDVPIKLPDGSVVMAPRKTAANTAIRAMGEGRQQETLTQRKLRDKAYISHIDNLAKKDQSEAARKIWLSGVADGNDELKAELQKRMGLAEPLPDSDKGTVDTDANGNLIVVHSRQASAKPITDTSGQPQASFKQTVQRDRNTNARLQRANSRGNALIMAGRQAAGMGDPAEFENEAKDAEEDAADAESQATELSKSGLVSDKRMAQSLRTEAARHRRQAREFRIKASQAGGAQRAVGQRATPNVNNDPLGILGP